MTIVFFLVNLIAASLVRYVVSNFEFKQAEEQSHNSFALFSVAIIDAVITEDIPLINTVVARSLERIPNITALSIESEKGKLFAKHSREDTIISNNIRDYHYAIELEGKRLGTINISWNMAPIQKKINRHITKFQLFIATIFSLLTGLTIILIHYLTVRPIHNATHYLTALSENKQSFPLKNRFLTNRELELLKISADNFVRIMQQREHDLLQTCKKLQISRDETLNANREKSDFLATVSHEIRIPMNAVLGVLSLLKNTSLDNKQLQLVRTGCDSGELLLTIINDILDFSKMEADKLQLKHTSFNLHRLLTNSVELLKPQADQKMLALILFLEADLPCYAKGDPDRLCQILINLINNAIKFTSVGRISIRASATYLGNESFTFRCSVQDTGIGIAKDFQASLFEKFTMGNQSHSRNHEGTGLGLAICKHLVTLMQGNINFDSTPGNGSTFTFTITLGTANEQESTDRTTLNKIQELPTTNTRILLAEDNPANQMVIKNILEHAGLQVDIATNGREAIEAVRTLPYDIVLMDVSMPDMDGISATREIRQLPGETGKLPIVALTAHSLSGDRERFIQAGMDDYLTKPIDHIATLHCIARWTKSINTQELKNDRTIKHTNPSSANAGDGYVAPLVDTDILQQLVYDTSPEIITELLTLYINDARKRIKKIQAAITTPDFNILEFESHTLSSSAITHGNLKLHHLAKKIEQFCQRGDYEKVLTYASSLSALANESFISLEKYRSTIKVGQESPES
ncbi:MAG: ATP-binding protein [Gammaproteobacteria bacterium]|nr:ATP-binding protein [Gammaproteobacteria bacterium]MCF6259435.1 ATP-binding protein [Gammaproteobacteria bacterium]